jgi:putative SOS response-associated peptidase YedK
VLRYDEFMCGRFEQSKIDRLIRDFEWAGELLNRSSAPESYNVAPGTYRPVLHVEDDLLLVDDLHWGYRSAWAEASGKVPMSINTRLEKVSGSYWKPLLKRGRAIVPAGGWYEWTGEKGNKQPWHIHRADRRPLYMAALANFAPETEHKASNGFTIVTADAQGGMVDIHDRRPVVLSAQEAALWLSPWADAAAAEELLRTRALGPENFEWYKVDRALGNVRSQGPKLVEPI